jgi:acetyltransferase-like isoleucine patch superfamily enzyme
MKIIKYLLGKTLLQIPIIRYKQFVYKLLGVKSIKNNINYFIGNPLVIGDYKNIVMHNNSEIERGCMLIANEKIEIGENSTLAYGVTILTSADPNGPYNKLSKLYPPINSPVIIKDNCWIGAKSIILPGLTIGEFSVVAAGSVVTKDVPAYSLVAGVPAVIKRKIEL